VQARLCLLAAHLDGLNLPHHGIAVHVLRQPHDTVGDREDGTIARLVLPVLPDEERGGREAGQMQGQPLQKRGQLHL
jgi:hypothetical protein